MIDNVLFWADPAVNKKQHRMSAKQIKLKSSHTCVLGHGHGQEVFGTLQSKDSILNPTSNEWFHIQSEMIQRQNCHAF